MKMRKTIWLVAVAIGLLLTASLANATVVTLPNETQSTTFTATASEQADVTVPATVTFAVTDVSSATQSTESVSATSIVLTNGNALKISLQASAADFTAATGGTNTWEDGNVSWNAATWTNGTGTSGTLINTSYTQVAYTSANAASTSTSNLIFTLAADATVDRAGDHTLASTWKFESYTP